MYVCIYIHKSKAMVVCISKTILICVCHAEVFTRFQRQWKFRSITYNAYKTNYFVLWQISIQIHMYVYDRMLAGREASLDYFGFFRGQPSLKFLNIIYNVRAYTYMVQFHLETVYNLYYCSLDHKKLYNFL